MFLSYSVRVTYFQTEESNSYNELDYALIVNGLIKPYLSKKGLNIYEKWVRQIVPQM